MNPWRGERAAAAEQRKRIAHGKEHATAVTPLILDDPPFHADTGQRDPYEIRIGPIDGIGEQHLVGLREAPKWRAEHADDLDVRLQPAQHMTQLGKAFLGIAEEEMPPRPWRHFFFGDSQECLAELRHVLGRLQPDIEIVGMLSPPFRRFTEADEMLFADTINRANPDFVWVALPGVRMERWIIENQRRYRRGVFLAVGDAFSLLSGRRSFAPPWIQRMGLTWAYRLCKEPIRLGPRYLRYNSMFLSYLLWDTLRRRAWQRSVR